MNNHAPLGKNHPVRHLLNASANGDVPSTRDLELLDHMDAELPPGRGLSHLKSSVNHGARQVAALGKEGRYAEARNLADDLAADIALRMSDEARALTNTHPVESALPVRQDGTSNLDDFARSIFNR
ncbi:hypothetical protein [Micrococcus luteus]|uniref:hypothetical protein n=1 Tax=Micrococcus luteus TaxID=1270 RepID=UPI0030171E9C